MNSTDFPPNMNEFSKVDLHRWMSMAQTLISRSKTVRGPIFLIPYKTKQIYSLSFELLICQTMTKGP